MTERKSLWTMKNEELLKLCIEYKIAHDPNNIRRKETIDAIVAHELSEGFIREAMECSDEEGDTLKPMAPPRKKIKYLDIIFHNQEGFPKYQFLGHNGRFLYLPREFPCRIPYEFIHVIKTSIATQIIQEKVGTKVKYRELKVPRMSYEILGQGEK